MKFAMGIRRRLKMGISRKATKFILPNIVLLVYGEGGGRQEQTAILMVSDNHCYGYLKLDSHKRLSHGH